MQHKILITGGAKRLGAAMARYAALQGWKIALHYNGSIAEAEALASELASQTEIALFQAPLEDADKTHAMIEAASKWAGGLTCLVNNASRFVYDDIHTATSNAFDQHMHANLRAPMLLSQAFAKQLPAGEAGVIINMLDQKLWGLNPDFLTYTLSKSGLMALTEMLAMELAPAIRVCGIAPGITLPSPKMSDENFKAAQLATPLQCGATVDDIVRTLAFLIDTPCITGHTVILDGGEHLLRRRRDVLFEAGKTA